MVWVKHIKSNIQGRKWADSRGEPRQKQNICVSVRTPNLRKAGMGQIEVTKDSEEMVLIIIKAT